MMTWQEGVEVLYVYELQLAGNAQRKGLGKHAMVLLDLVSRKVRFGVAMLQAHVFTTLCMFLYDIITELMFN